jgi:hypothetical protein
MFDLTQSEMKALEGIHGHIYQETLFFQISAANATQTLGGGEAR